MIKTADELVQQFEDKNALFTIDRLKQLKVDKSFIEYIWTNSRDVLIRINGSEEAAKRYLNNLDLSRIEHEIRDGGSGLKWAVAHVHRLVPEHRKLLSTVRFAATLVPFFNSHLLKYGTLTAVLVNWDLMVCLNDFNLYLEAVAEQTDPILRRDIINLYVGHVRQMVRSRTSGMLIRHSPAKLEALTAALRQNLVQILFLLLHEIGHLVFRNARESNQLRDKDLAEMLSALPPSTPEQAEEWLADTAAGISFLSLANGFDIHGTRFDGEAAKLIIVKSLCYLFITFHFVEKMQAEYHQELTDASNHMTDDKAQSRIDVEINQFKTESHPPAAHRLLCFLNTYNNLDGWAGAATEGYRVYDLIRIAFLDIGCKI